MKILAFDTATHACTVALMVGSTVVERFEIAPRRHTELILPMVEAVLAEAGVRLLDLDAIAFGQGPGSFMGVRLAAGIAQGLGFAVKKKLIPVSTLQAVAQAAYQQHGAKHVLASWDARMQQVYWGAYSLNDGGLMLPVSGELLSDPGKIAIDGANNWFAAGNGWVEYQDQLTSELLGCIEMVPEIIYPNAVNMLSIARHKWEQGEAVQPELAQPVYLRNKVV